jgi:hypothetical protein
MKPGAGNGAEAAVGGGDWAPPGEVPNSKAFKEIAASPTNPAFTDETPYPERAATPAHRQAYLKLGRRLGEIFVCSEIARHHPTRPGNELMA